MISKGMRRQKCRGERGTGERDSSWERGREVQPLGDTEMMKKNE